MTFIYTHTYISEFNTQWPLRGQFAIKPNHRQPRHLHLQIIYIIYVEKGSGINSLIQPIEVDMPLNPTNNQKSYASATSSILIRLTNFLSLLNWTEIQRFTLTPCKNKSFSDTSTNRKITERSKFIAKRNIFKKIKVSFIVHFCLSKCSFSLNISKHTLYFKPMADTQVQSQVKAIILNVDFQTKTSWL